MFSQTLSVRQHSGEHWEKFGRAAFPSLEFWTQLLLVDCCCALVGLFDCTLRWEQAQEHWATVTVGFEVLLCHCYGVWSRDMTNKLARVCSPPFLQTRADLHILSSHVSRSWSLFNVLMKILTWWFIFCFISHCSGLECVLGELKNKTDFSLSILCLSRLWNGFSDCSPWIILSKPYF